MAVGGVSGGDEFRGDVGLSDLQRVRVSGVYVWCREGLGGGRDKGVDMDETDEMHPRDGAAELGPAPADGGFCVGGPGGFSVDNVD